MPQGPIEHVVVLMLENRSFDHLLGFLDHPSSQFPRLRPELHSNLFDPHDAASPRVPVSPDATYTIPLDPPHSHESIMQQLNVSAIGRPRMDGFIASYARKARGEEPLPIVHWARLEALVLALAALPAALLAHFGGKARKAWPLVYLGAAALGSVALHRARATFGKGEAHEVGPEVMRCMAPDKIPVLATLAKEFAVCTRWHCSVPGETWPNRNFLHAATSEETVDIEVGFYEAPTIFELLERHGATWRVYHRGPAQLWAFWNLWRVGDRCARWEPLARFEEHVAADDLATYSFIEPDHDGTDSNSQHPNNNRPERGGSDFVGAEALVGSIYDVLRRHPEVFAKTMLVITYDEHGGLYDHVAPPTRVAAPAPVGRRLPLLRRLLALFVERGKVRFRFRILGPRVPTVIVSPRIPAGTVDGRLYDHSSVVATLRKLFAPSAEPLTARDAAANTFDHLARLATPRPTEELPQVVPPRVEPVPSVAAAAPPPPGEEDEFRLQLRRLARRLGAELDARGVAKAPAADLDGAVAATRPADTDDVARRFDMVAEQARRRPGP